MNSPYTINSSFCLVMSLAFTALTCRHASVEETAVKPMQVTVVPVKTEEVSLPVHCGGIVLSSREVRLSFKTGGIIAGIRVEEGARVNKGEVLATLNLSEIQAQVSQIRNGYEKAMRDYTRTKNLYTDTVATLEQLQNSETALNVARANLDQAEFNLDHSTILAPENGIVLKRLAETNEMIAPGYPVFLFGTGGRFWKLKAGLADRDFVRVQPGDSSLVTLDAYPDVRFHAVVSQMSESANPMTGTYEIELDLQPAGYKLASGFVANLEIYPGRKQSFTVVPVESIIQAEGQTGYVFVADDSLVVHKTEVRIASIQGAMVSISHGLEHVSSVITGGAAYLTDGDHVKIVK
jgi:membrane fusion protein, multidrug efflux system